ncbi:MAG: peptide ABC transporter substrate-binding protein [Desulfobacteraceae bacterium]
MKKITITLFVILVLVIACGRQVPILDHEIGTVIYNNKSEPETIDPSLYTGHPDATIIIQLFEGLISFHPQTLKPIPGVAERWEVSEDGKEYTFHLRKNAKWSDGKPVTAEDFRYSFVRLLDPKTAARYAYQGYYIKNGEKFNKGIITDKSLLGIDVIDDYTLKLTLESPTPYFPSLLYHTSLYPVRKDIVEKYGSDWIRPENIVGNGPFILKEWTLQKQMVMLPNPQYWDIKNVKPKKLIFYPIESVVTAYKMYQADQIMFTNPLPLPVIDKLIEDKEPELQIKPFFTSYFYKINTTLPALKNKKIRKALSLVIDRNNIVNKILKAGQIEAWTLVPPGIEGYEPPVPEFTKMDIPRAKELLAEGLAEEGLKEFPEIGLLYNTMEAHKKLALAVSDMWREHLDLNILPYNQEWKVYLKSEHNMHFQIIRHGWVGDYLDPNTFLDMFLTGGGNNNTGFANPEYDNLIKSASREQNPEKRFQILKEAEALLIDEQPIIPLYFYVFDYIKKPYLKGVYGNPMEHHNFKYAYIDEEELKKYYGL